MARRPLVLVLVCGAFLSMGASHRTQNFVVTAPTPQIAESVGQYAEHYRREKALQWLGREMPPWPEPCPLKVTVTMNGSGGATSFAFDRGQVLGQHMNIEGTVDRLLASVLPHEVTHTVFAFHFRQPVPRWADEGGSVLSEDDIERRRHDRLVRQILNSRRAFPLRRLFGLREYPNDVMVLYAQGYSVTAFLVGRSSRPAFLNFVADGMRLGWDNAVKSHYGFNSVEELERAWLDHLRNNREGQPPAEVARGPAASTAPTATASAAPAPRSPQVLVRQTAPPAQPLLEAPEPIYRGAMPDERPKMQWTPVPSNRPTGPPTVRLGAPEFSPAAPGPNTIRGPGFSP